MSTFIKAPQNIKVQEYVKPDFKRVSNIIQSDSGLGFSNFRVSQSKRDLIDPMAKYNSNGFSLAEYENERHLNKIFDDHYADVPSIDQQEQDPDYIYWDIVKTLEERGPVMDAFFSKRNLDHIQNLLVKMVEFQSDGLYKISRQNDNIILEGMRLTFVGSPINALSTGDELRRTIASLNKNVLNVAVPYVFSGIQKHLSYVKDQGNMPWTMDQPKNMSEKGTRLNKGFDFNIF